MPWIYIAPRKKHQPKTYPLPAALVFGLAVSLAGFVRRGATDATDVAISGVVCMLLVIFRKLL